MSEAINKVTSFSGEYYIKESDGSLRVLSVGDVIHEGDVIIGKDGNPAESQITIDTNGFNIVLSGNEAQKFDLSLLEDELSADETVSSEESISNIIAETIENDSTEENAEDVLDTEAGSETPSSNDTSLKSKFAQLENNEVNVNSDLRLNGLN
jgi:hypothetical protein